MPPIHYGRTDRLLQCDGFTVLQVAYDPWSRVPPHRHERAHLALLISGEMLESGRAAQTMHEPGSALLRPAGQAHENQFYAAETRGYIVELSDARWRSIAPLLPTSERTYAASVAGARRFHAQLRREIASCDAATPAALEGAILLFLAGFVRAAASDLAVPPAWFAAIVERIDRDPASQSPLAELAGEESIAPAALAAAFRKFKSCTFARYRLKRRLELARSMLSATTHSISDVASACGFFDHAHLTRTFARESGMSPQQFRRRAL